MPGGEPLALQVFYATRKSRSMMEALRHRMYRYAWMLDYHRRTRCGQLDTVALSKLPCGLILHALHLRTVRDGWMKLHSLTRILQNQLLLL